MTYQEERKVRCVCGHQRAKHWVPRGSRTTTAYCDYDWKCKCKGFAPKEDGELARAALQQLAQETKP